MDLETQNFYICCLYGNITISASSFCLDKSIWWLFLSQKSEQVQQLNRWSTSKKKNNFPLRFSSNRFVSRWISIALSFVLISIWFGLYRPKTVMFLRDQEVVLWMANSMDVQLFIDGVDSVKYKKLNKRRDGKIKIKTWSKNFAFFFSDPTSSVSHHFCHWF